MTEYDLMEDPEDELPVTDLRKRADRLLLFNEFALAYQTPIEEKYPEVSYEGRGYLTVWVNLGDTEADDPVYSREQGISGDDGMIRHWLSEAAREGYTHGGRVESLLSGT